MKIVVEAKHNWMFITITETVESYSSEKNYNYIYEFLIYTFQNKQVLVTWTDVGKIYVGAPIQVQELQSDSDGVCELRSFVS